VGRQVKGIFVTRPLPQVWIPPPPFHSALTTKRGWGGRKWPQSIVGTETEPFILYNPILYYVMIIMATTETQFMCFFLCSLFWSRSFSLLMSYQSSVRTGFILWKVHDWEQSANTEYLCSKNFSLCQNCLKSYIVQQPFVYNLLHCKNCPRLKCHLIHEL
jgi:hypothetical protein